MYLKVLTGKINYKGSVHRTGDLFECRKDIGLRLVQSELCEEVSEDLYKVMTRSVGKSDVMCSTTEVRNSDKVTKKTATNKTIDDLRNEL